MCIRDSCRAHQVYIISDEIHQDLVFGENKHIPSLSTGEYDDIMVSIVAASKTFNIAGAQNSMVIIPDEKLQEKWDAYVKGNRVLGGNAFGYVAADVYKRQLKHTAEAQELTDVNW